MNLWVIFLTGLTVGGLTCLAVQGGLLASVIAAREEEEIDKGINTKNPVFPTFAFLITKLIAYSILGLILGAFGGALNISTTAQTTMQAVAGVYMIIVALNLLEVHPIFRYAIIQPPRFLTSRIKNQSKSKDLFAPAFLGAMTIFIPCGTTLAMEALAISSGNPIKGATIMAAFVLGTMPVFFGVGWLTSILGDNFREKFLRIAALAIIYLGATSINGALIATGSPLTMRPDLIKKNSQAVFSSSLSSGVQNVNISITGYGYSPNYIKVQRGKPVRLTLKSTDAYSCASAFRIPSLGIAKNLQPNGTEVIQFTPNTSGEIAFTCSMGMYRGVIEVL